MLAKQNYYKRYFIYQIMSQAFFNNANDLLWIVHYLVGRPFGRKSKVIIKKIQSRWDGGNEYFMKEFTTGFFPTLNLNHC
jgi:hypothetical protein